MQLLIQRITQVLLVAGVLPFLLHARLARAASLDYAVPDGWFYPQANGQGGIGGAGFTVTNAAGTPFWTTFVQAGGVVALGYPASQRYTAGGFTEQVFQKTVLQWDGQNVAFLNVLDVLHAAGKDGWLQAAWMTPPPASTADDAGLPWSQVVARHQGYLDASAPLKAAYFAVTDPLDRYGLPVSPVTDEGPALVVRCQRAVLQLWKQAMPWAAAGSVTVANAGDILKASGLIAASALSPSAGPGAGDFTYVALGASDAAGYGASTPAHGYVPLLSNQLAARVGNVRTIDLGIIGATTADVVSREASQLAALQPTLVTITIGPNDILNLVPPTQFNRSLDQLLTTAQSAHPSVIALANMPDFSLAPAVPDLLRPIARQFIIAYNAIIAAQARAHGVILVDLYDPSITALTTDPNLVAGDGFHPDDAGYALYDTAFWGAVAGIGG